MPATTGGSHALASFVTLVLGSLFSKYVWELAPPLGETSIVVIEGVRALTGAPVPVDDQFAGTLVVMVGISFVWGVLYHVGRHE